MSLTLNKYKVTVDSLRCLQAELISYESGPSFLGIPERWYADGPDKPYGHPDRGAKFRCVNGHVSRMILKSECFGDLCLACQGPLVMTFPEDVDDKN